MSDKLQERFLAELGQDSGFIGLFELLDDVAFFVKNRQFQLIYANCIQTLG